MPEWRKELSEKVREVQEKRAREAAREAAEAERQRLEAAVSPPQLELLPPTPSPAMNPLVAAALKRIERAHQTAPSESRQPRTTLATAVAYAPEREDNDMSETVPLTPQLAFEEPEILQAEPEVTVEKAHHLSMVPVSEPLEIPAPPPIETPKAPPKRLIKDDDPALNYLDSISGNLCIDDLNKRSASAFRRLVGAVLDLIFCAILTAPIAGAIYLTGNHLQDPRAIGVLTGSLVVVTFIYLTLMTALTGRTWAMRLLSLRVIDTKTGLIPTGGQSIGRSFFYLMSLATGFGILFGLISREGYTIHDRITRTAVVTSGSHSASC
jgi:uncharacterized RDD family membrane protein YckC